MKEIISYLDDLKGKTGSDYASAKALKITKESVSKIRSRGQMSDETAIKMADLLGVDRTELLIAAAIARSNGDVKESWLNLSKLCGYAASFFFALSGSHALFLDTIKGWLCILCKINAHTECKDN